MGDKITLNLEARELHGKKVSALRRQGKTPAVVYGSGLEPVAVQADAVAVLKVTRDAGLHTPVHLKIGSKNRIAMIKDIDIDPVKNTVRHVAFHAVRQNQPVEAEIPIRLVGEGESEAERAGLVVLQTLESVEVKALPLELPEALEVSIVDMKEAGDRVTVADIKLPEGVEIVDNDDGRHDDADEDRSTVMDLVVASVYEPSALQAANEAAGGDAEDESEVESENGSESAEDETEADKADAEKS